MTTRKSRGFIFALIVLALLMCNGNQVFADDAIVDDVAAPGMDSELAAHTNEDLLAGSGATTEDIWDPKPLHMLPVPPDGMVWEAIYVDYWVRVDLSDPDDLQTAIDIGLTYAEQGVYEYLLHGGMLEKLLEAGIEAETIEGVTRCILRRDPETLPDRADETNPDGQIGVLVADDCFESKVGPYLVPDQGYVEDSLEITCAPTNAYVTGVEYRIRIDDQGDPSTFYCGDYEIYIGAASTPDHLVYDNLGGRTDGGYDDDIDDDSDIYLTWRSTTFFNGEPANQAWRVRVADVYAGDVGQLDYFEFMIYWESLFPAISLSPSSLTPSCTQGQNAPSQTFEVWNSGVDTLSYSIADDVSWISSISPSSGTSTGEHDTITINYDTTGLSAGVHAATITISDTNASNDPQTIGVTLTVDPPPPAISLSPSSLTQSCPLGENAASQTFEVWNSGGSTLSYSITEDTSWISSTSPSSGTSTGEHDTITVNYETTGLAEGVYEAIIVIASPDAANSPQHISVAIDVIQVPTISTYPLAFTNSCNQGTNAFAQDLEVWNSGTGTLSYSVSDDASWLNCSPANGTSTGEVDSITVYYETAGLDAGTYNATITISDTNASNDPLLVSVELNVYPAQLTQINCVSPTNESILSSPPTFTWSTYGGTNHAFIVDMAPSLRGPLYSSPVVYEPTWSIPTNWWNFIPSGTFVYWRVRGAELNVTPLTIIASDEVWWLYKR
jgi:subtilisin-like proprotein convertase family protein